MIGRCQTCKHWNGFTESYMRQGWGQCEMTSSESGEGSPESLAVAQDYESYAAILETAAEYGCVMYQEKAAA
jgi:predicted ATP-dependent serine protease